MTNTVDMSINAIAERVGKSMCMTHGAAFPDGRMEARITQEDWDHVLKVIRFYARHEHWMSISEDGPCKVLIANGDVPGVDGWAMAEGVRQ